VRETVLEIVVIALSLAALVRPRVGLYAYTWFALMRPDFLAWAPGAQPYSLVLAIATLISSLRYIGAAWSVLTNPISRWLILLQLAVLASVFFAVERDLAWGPFDGYIRGITMSLLIPLLIESPRQLKTLVIIMAISIGSLGAKFGLYGLLQGGVRYSGGYGGMLSDNNTLALGLVMGMALCWYARGQLSSVWLRAAFLGMAALGLAGTIMTYSRGAALALVAALLVVIYRSKRRLATLAVISAICLPILYLVGAPYMDRLATLQAPEEDSSARSRLENYTAAVQMWKDYPILGVGFGEENERRLLSRYTNRDVGEADLVIHNTYLQLLVDSGAPAFLIYTGLLIGTIFWLGSAGQRSRAEEMGMQHCLQAIQLALITFSIGALFLSREQFDFAYMLLMSAAAWWRIQRSVAETDIGPISMREAAPVPA
jgi:putative inorganic carbon (hco3(-)) transporter